MLVAVVVGLNHRSRPDAVVAGAAWSAANVPDAVVAGAAWAAPTFGAAQLQRIATMLRLRGGGTRNKWRRKQNKNHGSTAGNGRGGYGHHRGRRDSGVKPTGGAGGEEQDRFFSRWSRFSQHVRGGARNRPAATKEQGDLFSSSSEEDSDGSNVMYVDEHGNEVPASQVDSDMVSDGVMGGSSGEYIYVDEHGNPVGGPGGVRFRSPPPGAPVNNTAFYTLMGLDRNCTEDEIKKAYRRQALKWHPDKNPDNKTVAEEMFKKVSDVYHVLSDSSKRAIYDKYGEEALADGAQQDSEEGVAGGVGVDPYDIFSQFFGAQGGGAVFEMDIDEGLGGGGGSFFSFTMDGGSDDEDDAYQDEEEEWQDADAVHRGGEWRFSGRRGTTGERGGRRGRGHPGRSWRTARGRGGGGSAGERAGGAGANGAFQRRSRGGGGGGRGGWRRGAGRGKKIPGMGNFAQAAKASSW